MPREAASGSDQVSWGARLLRLEDTFLILASGSPRRSELLRALGIRFRARPVSLDESPLAGETAEKTALRLARAKAFGVAETEPQDVVVGADTLVVIGNAILGKPEDDAEAMDMLRRLSGRTHEVITGLAVVRIRDGAVFSEAETTRVTFRNLEPREIEWMVASGESKDKAGGYGIQGLGSLAVTGIAGDYFNVMGLPLGLLRKLLQKAAET